MTGDGVHERLERALAVRKLSIRKFHAALQGDGYPHTSYQAVRRYLKGQAKPTSDFLAAATRILRVRPEWLVLGEGPGTYEEWEKARRREMEAFAVEALDRVRNPDEHFLSTLDELGPRFSPERSRRHLALIRFSRKMFDAGPVSSDRWARVDLREDLLRAAGRFLVGVETAFEQASRRYPDRLAQDGSLPNRLDELLVTRSASDGWYIQWSDGVLQLFASRVIGLGERDPNNSWDSHSPVARARALEEHREWQEGVEASSAARAKAEGARDGGITRPSRAQKAKRPT